MKASRLLRPLVAILVLWTASLAVADDDPFGPSKRGPAGLPAGREPEERPPDLEAFRPWLAHEDWVCRALAARELSRRSEDGVVTLLTRALVQEEDPRVTALFLRALAGRLRDELLIEGGPLLVDRVVALLDHAHPTIREKALKVLEPIPPVRLGLDPARYRSWWPKGKDGLLAERVLAIERRGVARGAARGSTPMAPGETKTVAPLGTERYRDLDRIHREGLEVVICLDSTGSMGDVISAAKANVVDLVRRLRSLAPRVRVGLVTYDDGAAVRIALTTDEQALEKELKKVEAAGGDDPPEGVDKAIKLAYRQEAVAWSRKAERVIVVVGDAPPHEEDVLPLWKFLEKRRDDPMFEAPIRIDTISTGLAGDADENGLVPHFAEIAARGRGTALRLRSARELVTELVTASFGPSWREPIRDLLNQVDAFERATPKRNGR